MAPAAKQPWTAPDVATFEAYTDRNTLRNFVGAVMFKFIKSFRYEAHGAVTVDWVVLTAAIVGLAVGLIAMISSGATDISTSVGAFLSTHEGVGH